MDASKLEVTLTSLGLSGTAAYLTRAMAFGANGFVHTQDHSMFFRLALT